MPKEIFNQQLLENMWSEEARSWETIEEDAGKSSDDAMRYVRIEEKNNTGECDGSFKPQFLRNKHKSKTIKTTIKVTASSLTNTTNSTRQVKVYPGDEKSLGCNGINMFGMSGTYKRKIVAAWFV